MTIQMYWFNSNQNFGDQLSPMLCHTLSGHRVSYTDDFRRCDLVAIGSILHMVKNPDAYTGAVWGAGFIEAPSGQFRMPKARVCAVRGRLTQRLLGCGNDVALGDPGLLCDIYAKPVPKKYRLGIVPHFVDAGNQLIKTVSARQPGVAVIDVEQDVQSVIDNIASCEMILSSSLHGLIVADSLSIPNGWVRFSDKVLGGAFKFEDYYSVYEIQSVEPIPFDEDDSIDSVREKLHGYQRSGLDDVKQKLRESFPFKNGALLKQRLTRFFQR